MKLNFSGSKSNRKKGQETFATVFGTVLIAAIVVFFFFYIYPLFFGDLFKSIALSSAEIVARDIAGFISVSAAAPNEIKITYNPSESNKYNTVIGDRLVQVTLAIENAKINEKSTAKVAIGDIAEKFDIVNSFEIRKNVITSIDSNGVKLFNNINQVSAK